MLASATAIIASPAVLKPCSSISRPRPDSPAPWAWVTWRTRRAPPSAAAFACEAMRATRRAASREIRRSPVASRLLALVHVSILPSVRFTGCDGGESALVTTKTERRPATDTVLTGAVDLARAAAEELAEPGQVGEHLGVRGRGRAARHPLLRLSRPGLPRLALGRHRHPRVPEQDGHRRRGRAAARRRRAAGPGVGAVERAAQARRPRRRRPAADRARTTSGCVPGYTCDRRRGRRRGRRSGSSASAAPRVLSPIGRDDAVDRWYSGDHGPTAPIAEAAPAHCATCGFLRCWPARCGRCSASAPTSTPRRRPGRLRRPRLRRALRGRGHARPGRGDARRSSTRSASTCIAVRPAGPHAGSVDDDGPRRGPRPLLTP